MKFANYYFIPAYCTSTDQYTSRSSGSHDFDAWRRELDMRGEHCCNLYNNRATHICGLPSLGVLFTSLGPILSKVSTVLTSLNRCISTRQMYRRNLQRSSFVCTSKNMEVCWHSQGVRVRVCDKMILLSQATVSSISTYRFSSNSLIKRRWRVRLVSLPHKNQKHNDSDDAPTSNPEFSFLLTSRWETNDTGKIWLWKKILDFWLNRPFSHSRDWTGASLQVRLIRGIFSNASDIFLRPPLQASSSPIPRTRKRPSAQS